MKKHLTVFINLKFVTAKRMAVMNLMAAVVMMSVMVTSVTARESDRHALFNPSLPLTGNLYSICTGLFISPCLRNAL